MGVSHMQVLDQLLDQLLDHLLITRWDTPNGYPSHRVSDHDMDGCGMSSPYTRTLVWAQSPVTVHICIRAYEE